jgi:hypothetical protein
LFIVLSLAAALLLPMSRIIEVKSCTYLPGLHDPALRGGVTDCHRLLIIIFVRESINFNQGLGGIDGENTMVRLLVAWKKQEAT